MSNYISVEDNGGLSQSQGSIEAVLLSETCPQEYFSNFWVMDFEDNMFIVEGSLIEELLSCEDESNTKGIIEFDWCNRFLDSLDSRRISGVIQSSTMIFQEEEVENFVRSAVLFQRRRAGKERGFKKRRLYTYVFSNFRRFVGDVFCFNWLSMLRTIDFRCGFLIDALFSLKLGRMLEKLRRLGTLRKYYKFVIKRSQLDQFPISEQYFFDVKMGLNDFVVHEIAKIRNPYNRGSFMNLDLGTTDFGCYSFDGYLLQVYYDSYQRAYVYVFEQGGSGLVYSTFNFFGDVNSFSTRLFWSSNVLKVLFANGTTCNVSYSGFDVGVSLMFGSPGLDFLKWVVHRVKHGKFNFLIRTASDIRCNLVENELYYDLFFNVFLFFSLLRHQVYINAADFFGRSYDNGFFFSNRFFGKQMIMSEPFGGYFHSYLSMMDVDASLISNKFVGILNRKFDFDIKLLAGRYLNSFCLAPGGDIVVSLCKNSFDNDYVDIQLLDNDICDDSYLFDLYIRLKDQYFPWQNFVSVVNFQETVRTAEFRNMSKFVSQVFSTILQLQLPRIRFFSRIRNRIQRYSLLRNHKNKLKYNGMLFGGTPKRGYDEKRYLKRPYRISSGVNILKNRSCFVYFNNFGNNLDIRFSKVDSGVLNHDSYISEKDKKACIYFFFVLISFLRWWREFVNSFVGSLCTGVIVLQQMKSNMLEHVLKLNVVLRHNMCQIVEQMTESSNRLSWGFIYSFNKCVKETQLVLKMLLRDRGLNNKCRYIINNVFIYKGLIDVCENRNEAKMTKTIINRVLNLTIKRYRNVVRNSYFLFNKDTSRSRNILVKRLPLAFGYDVREKSKVLSHIYIKVVSRISYLLYKCYYRARKLWLTVSEKDGNVLSTVVYFQDHKSFMDHVLSYFRYNFGLFRYPVQHVVEQVYNFRIVFFLLADIFRNFCLNNGILRVCVYLLKSFGALSF